MDNDEDITAITTTTASENDESSELERDPTQRNEFPTSSVTGCVSGSSAGAKYRLMSPAKLPISRSACLTIPPGLSPTSFIESPVLLSDMKVEPSPTTGSFIKPQMMHLFSTTSFSNANKFDERKSRSFEFRPHDGSYSGSVIPSVRPKIPADMNHQQSECSFQGEGQCQTQSFSLLPSLKNEVPVSNELSLSVPVHMFPPKDSLVADTKCDELDQRGQHNARFQASQSDHKGIVSSVAAERVSDDGYNWRKYGQKHVKGSEHPRSYYKCTHPNCEVKKLFERSHDGQITEIVYKGEHDHPKPQSSRRLTSGAILSVQEERTEKVLSVTSQDDKSSNIYGQMAHNMEQNGGLDNVEAASQDEIDDDDPLSKRRRMDVEMLDVTPVVKPIREPRVVVQTLSEVDILDDGYRWRKYGQKVVRGNPNPRSYYKCTNAGCPVRKHVERASHDPKAVITTYEGKHNHDVPTAKANSHETAGLMPLNAMSRIRSDERDTISLDLGVGISSAPESRSNEQQQTLQSELVESQIHTGNSINMLQAAPVSSYYRVLNGGINQYGSRQNLNEGHFESPPLTHSSNPYPQNMGRILMGP